MENFNSEQEPRIVSPFSHAMRWGLLVGLCFIVNFFLSVPNILVLSLLTWVLDVFILYFVYRITCNYRDKECDGQIRYSQVLSYVILLMFFAALVAGIVKFIFLQFISPDYLSSLYNQTMLQLEGIGFDIPADFSDEFEKMMQPIQYTFQSITGDCFLGCILGLIYGFCIRRSKQ